MLSIAFTRRWVRLAAAFLLVAAVAIPLLRAATPAQAQEAIGFIRALVGDRDGSAAERVRIIYGGSVKPENIGALMAQEDIDGALVGGASLVPTTFANIVKYE